MDYKSTIRLPVTDFPMKGNLPQKEPEMIASWEQKKIYSRMLEKNKGKTKFILPDGPPYANGSIHVGHALNKTLKDIVVKYKNMKGFAAPFVPGWDCHGLPIEHKVMKDLSDKKITKTDHEILGLCRAEAGKWVEHQSKQFVRLGILADWKNPYMTMQSSYEAEEVREFARAFKKGLIYRGEKPVYWNWTLKTALADAEVEYHMHRSPSIYVKFDVEDFGSAKKLGFSNGVAALSPKKLSFVIWTTTPWTLPANVGICLHPDFEYGVYDSGSDYLIIAKGLKESFEKETGLQLNLLREFKGSDLEGLKARHPWIDRDSLIVLGLHVSLDAGTGCVHTAPGHGADDYKVGLKYQLPVLCPVNESGAFTNEVGPLPNGEKLEGVNIFKANPKIVEYLRSSGNLLKFSEFEHSYPHCWRSKTPLIFRTTPQWFLGLDLENSHIRKKVLQTMKDVRFVPEWGQARFHAMMENRPDWCLSRQRIWGVPIPIYYCKATSEPLLDVDVMMKIADVIENKGGIEAFYQTSPDDVVGKFQKTKEMEKFPNFGSQGFRHGKDILDVWFDSGVYHSAVQKRHPDMSFPADIYLEGSDQHRGWFNTSYLTSMATNDCAPFKTLLTHGFVVDSQGRKQSKSLGNVVDPNDVAAKSGAEIIRLWAAYEDYGKDVSCGPEELTRVTETYRRIRNTMRFLLGALHDFDATKNRVAVNDMTTLDKWALNELNELIEKVIEAFDNYDFYKVYHALNTFFTVTLSATYLDILKDRLYTWKADGKARRGSQTVLYDLTDSLIRIMAPILSFLSEESYQYMKQKSAESVFLLDFPTPKPEWKNPEVKNLFTELLRVRTEVQKKLELLRTDKTIGASLEAKVVVTADGDALKSLQSFSKDLREFFIVSEVQLKSGNFSISAEKAEGEKCVRCWIYSTNISKDEKHPGVCPKCVEALT